jgi:chromosome segregation ATPase
VKHAEERISQLADQISELTSQLKQRDSSLSLEREKRLGAEQDLQRQKILFERTQRELTTQSTKSSALRAEGRRARKEIVQAAEYLREVAGILQASMAHSADVTLRLTNDSSLSYDLENIDTATPTQRSSHHSLPRHTSSSAATAGAGVGVDSKDADPLGIKEISSVFETIKNLTQVVRQIPQQQLSLESTVRRYDTENQRLQRELDGIEVVYEDRIQRLESENRLLEEQVQVLKNREIGKLEETRSVTQLQHENNLLRAKCDRADQKEKELLLEIASYSEYSSSKTTTTERGGPQQQPSLAHSSSEVDQLQREIRALQQELDAVRHHRTVLQDSVSQLELLVYRDSDEYHSSSHKYSASLTAPTPATGAGSGAGDLDQLALQVNRLERRQQSLDELIAVYRKGLLGLYADGSFYGSTQYASLKSAHGFQATGLGGGSGGGWIEREIDLIKKSYVTEIEVLEKYCGSLSARVRQGESYCSELRVRLEDTLRALYK